MIGLAYLVAGVLYLLVSIWFVSLAVKSAKRRGKTGWKWGLAVGLAMYLLVFWDWIPTVVAHKYYCARYAGFTQFKSLDKWKRENSGTIKGLDFNADWEGSPKIIGGKYLYRINQRISLETTRTKAFMYIVRKENRVFDRFEEEVLVERVDYGTDILPFAVSARSLTDYKFWLRKNTCDTSGSDTGAEKFKTYLKQVELLGR